MSCCSNNNAVDHEANENNRERVSSRLSNLVNTNPLASEQIRSSRGAERKLRINQATAYQRLKSKIEKTKLMWRMQNLYRRIPQPY